MLEKIVINDKEEALSLTLWRAVEIDACWSLNSRKGVCECVFACAEMQCRKGFLMQ